MTKFQRIGVWLVVGLLAAGAAAQTVSTTAATPAHPRGPFVQIIRLVQQLNLSADQKTQLQALLQSARQQVKSIREDTTLTPQQRREKVKEVVKQTRTDFVALLTPAQHAHLVHLMQTRGLLAGIARLQLTDAQKGEVKALVQKQREDIRAVRQNTALDPEQKKQEIKQIREASQKQFLALLTPEQAKLWLQMHPHWGASDPNSPTGL